MIVRAISAEMLLTTRKYVIMIVTEAILIICYVYFVVLTRYCQGMKKEMNVCILCIYSTYIQRSVTVWSAAVHTCPQRPLYHTITVTMGITIILSKRILICHVNI